MSRIEADHLAREAIVYVRQSTADQVLHNVESRRRQYGLVERARQLGWAAVSVIDDDLGRSGSDGSRPGFEKLLAAICEGRVGIVVSIEASRLARNGRDWHTLLEFRGLVHLASHVSALAFMPPKLRDLEERIDLSTKRGAQRHASAPLLPPLHGNRAGESDAST